MKQLSITLLSAAILPLAIVQAQTCSAKYGQCGGVGWTGPTCCPAGWTCQQQGNNIYYSQCLPGTGSSSSSSSQTSTTTRSSSSTTSSSASTTLTSTTSTSTSPTSTPSSGTGNDRNPYLGAQFYATPYYASEITTSINSFKAAGDSADAAKAAQVQSVGTAIWIDVAAKIPNITTYLDDALALQKSTGQIQAVTFVVYDLPDRDCAAAASNGEFTVANDGLTHYKAYIDGFHAAFAAHPDNRIICIIEPDSLGNLVTNLNVPKCSAAANTYKAGIAYAIQQLQFPNVALYLDAAHAGWLGWPANLQPAATLFSQVLQSAAPATIRGFSTNVANYNAFHAATPDPITQGSSTPDEESYIAALTPHLQALNVPANFVTDTGRNGVQGIRQAWGDWCNVKGAGFGVRPTTNTGVANVDAFLWVKPGGESDGTSNSSAARYDFHCGQSDAAQPAPEAGTWFDAYFQALVKNANPSL
ncbi:hypothetical protein BZG36_04615 [Bifiguratus adelaidae]|uniref:Glucanase n=1 Tax=Bifiguratus adelaidae TaxID=1938954 RepID=A0A261XX62_9FUNG|nr:hypothetical protein BZG36_04615 [Bifiguratus adelaidae]